ncbi:MAG: methylmalonyl-CoA epimerase [Candidatus Hatepunaea meridiana]|nr:methylmalonyl-CoA epimerase [Candidatus Hatepunaea meridiana]
MINKVVSFIPDAKLDHIGIAVRDLDEATEKYQMLGITLGDREIVSEQGVQLQMLPGGDCRLELLQPISDDSPIAAFLEKRGEGLHHIALRVNDIRATLTRCKAAGVRLINEEPRAGAGGCLIAFINPKSTGGVLIELVQDNL